MIARIAIVSAFLVVAGSPLRAQSGIRADADSTAMAEIEALEYHLIDLLENRDLDAYASFLAEDYVRVNAAGRVDSKESVLEQFRSGSGGSTSVPSDIDVRIYGDTAVLSFVLTIERNGEAVRRSRLVKVFVRRDGRWIMVHNQGTPLE
jgi:ketosteroid isomerase-like protein